MRRSISNKIMTKKIHTIVIAIAVYAALVIALGVDFFSFDFVKKIDVRSVRINQFYYLLGILFYDVVKCYVIMLLFFNMFNGNVTKHIVLFSFTFVYCLYVHNIYDSSLEIIENLKNSLVYIPKYINVISFVFCVDEIFKIVKKFNNKFYKIVYLLGVILFFALLVAIFEVVLIIIFL